MCHLTVLEPIRSRVIQVLHAPNRRLDVPILSAFKPQQYCNMRVPVKSTRNATLLCSVQEHISPSLPEMVELRLKSNILTLSSLSKSRQIVILLIESAAVALDYCPPGGVFLT